MKIVALVQDKVQEEIKSSEIREVVVGFNSLLSEWARSSENNFVLDSISKHTLTNAVEHPKLSDCEISQTVALNCEQKLFRDFQFGALLTLMENYDVEYANAMATMTVTKPRPEITSKKSGYYFPTSFDQPMRMVVPVEDSPMIESTLTHVDVAQAAVAAVDWDGIVAQIKSRNDGYWRGVAFAPSQHDVADLMNHPPIGSGMSYYRNSRASAAPGIEPARWPDDEGYSLKA